MGPARMTSSKFCRSCNITIVWVPVTSGGMNVPSKIAQAITLYPNSNYWYTIGTDRRCVSSVNLNLDDTPSMLLVSTSSFFDLITVPPPSITSTSITAGEWGFPARLLMRLQPPRNCLLCRNCWVEFSASTSWYSGGLSRWSERNAPLVSDAYDFAYK